MNIEKVVIENFKGFKDRFTIPLNSGLNIIVGDNEAGKSTILEAINLALTGIYGGRYIRNELSQYLFNEIAVKEYIKSLVTDAPLSPPTILIELYISESDDVAFLEGDKNTDRRGCSGISFSVAFDVAYKSAYEALIKTGSVKTIPIEYYRVVWQHFGREAILARNIPIKSAYIDSSGSRFKNGSDIYIGRIVKEFLTEEEIVNVSQSHRQMKEHFISDPSIKAINEKIEAAGKISKKKVSISVELSTRNAWETGLVTYLDNIPFHFIGKGEQSIVKTNLALAHNKAKQANVILLEEPENHLSHTNLNQLIRNIKDNCGSKQIIITTHSSFVANKLGLVDLILLNNKKILKLNELSTGTQSFFEKVAGYDTLRLVLSTRTILVEGGSDELVVQKAYMLKNGGRLPIEDGIEVISVGTAFLRFLEIADKLLKPISVVTDNDGNVKALETKYADYLGGNKKKHVKICFDSEEDEGNLKIGKLDFNYNTMEPKFVKINGLDVMNKVLGVAYGEIDDLHKYMKNEKTECALKIFQTDEGLQYPSYILESIDE